MSIRTVPGDQLTAQDVYDIWKIRDAVFAVEQRVDEEDVDGLDLLATTTHLWLDDSDGPTSYLRVLEADGYLKVGRVCTRRDQRGKGLSGQLMREVNERYGEQLIKISAQAYLEKWYEGFGFVRTGDNYDEAGIDHLPMRREPTPSP
ncbi:MAG: family N-acetyltransferase [Nocardioidaceae bacterium]|nr:family N-acetyltransferase [Nocardioidaceae bacterium]